MAKRRTSALLLFSALALAVPAGAATLTVTSTADAGAGSLRQAILDANANPGADTIVFNIVPGGHVIIAPGSQLPIITDALTMNGTTQPGFAGAPVVELTGSGSVANGLVIDASSVTIRGLVVNRFADTGIRVAATAARNAIQFVGNYIGTDFTGLVAAANVNGVEVLGVSLVTTVDNVVIGTAAPADRNVIAGNTGNQVSCVFARSVSIAGNYIGVGADGSASLGGFAGIVMDAQGTIGGATAGERNVISQNSFGIELRSNAVRTVRGNYIGTDATGLIARPNFIGIQLEDASTVFVNDNVISGNSNDGIRFLGSSTNDTIVRNFIGTNPAGSAALPNGSDGIEVGQTSTGITIGGLSLGNVISGNNDFGVRLSGTSSRATLIGNRIGTNSAGTAAIPNTSGGVLVIGGASALIGSSSAGGSNVISGNGGDGITLVSSKSCTVVGNVIGLTAGGSGALPNGGSGVDVLQSSASRIGGSNPGEGNVIAFNGEAGVAVGSSSTGDRILGNSIHDNVTLGIDLGSDGVTPNDSGDADSGANTLQNFPVLTSATTGAAGTRILGALNSTPSTTFRIEFFSNATPDPSGFGEGGQFQGFTSVTTDAGGNAAIDVTLPAFTGFVSSTASTSSTSEFSNNVAVALLPVDVSVTKHASTTLAAVGNDLTYTITVANAGPNAASGVTTTDVLPAGMSLVSATPTQGSCSGTTASVCALGTLAPAASATITLVVRPAATGTFVNAVSVTAVETDANPGNNTANAEPVNVVTAAEIPTAGTSVLLLLGAALMVAAVLRLG